VTKLQAIDKRLSAQLINKVDLDDKVELLFFDDNPDKMPKISEELIAPARMLVKLLVLKNPDRLSTSS